MNANIHVVILFHIQALEAVLDERDKGSFSVRDDIFSLLRAVVDLSSIQMTYLLQTEVDSRKLREHIAALNWQVNELQYSILKRRDAFIFSHTQPLSS